MLEKDSMDKMKLRHKGDAPIPAKPPLHPSTKQEELKQLASNAGEQQSRMIRHQRSKSDQPKSTVKFEDEDFEEED